MADEDSELPEEEPDPRSAFQREMEELSQETKRKIEAERRRNEEEYEAAARKAREQEKEYYTKQRRAKAAKLAGKVAGKAALGVGKAALAAPGAALRGVGSLGRGTAGAYNSLNKGFMAAQEATLEAAKVGYVATKATVSGLFVLFAVLLHLYDLLHGFSLAGGHRAFMFTAYMLLAFWAGFGHYRTRFSRATAEHFAVSVIAWGLPYIQLLPGFGRLGTVADNIVVLLALTPVWFYYVAFNPTMQAPPIVQKLGILLLTVTVFLFFILALTRVSIPSAMTPGGQVNVGAALRNFWSNVRSSSADIYKQFWDSGFLSVRSWRTSLNNTFNPAAHFYTGRVEESDVMTGVFIEDLRAPIDEFFLDSDFTITLLANLNAETVFDKDIEVWPSCRLEAVPNAYRGHVEEQSLPIRLNNRLDRPVRCTFRKHANMSAGPYAAYLAATFDFETWAYITDTFVARSTIENYNAQNRDINADLHIPQRSEAVYTDGPVMLAIDGDRQPIDIDPTATGGNILQQRLGFTLQNRWPQGRLMEVYEVQLIVPKPFRLNNCFPQAPARVVDGDPNTDDAERQDVRTYIFRGEVFDDPRYDFKTVTCDLDLASPADARRVLSHGEKVPVTFVAIAKYKYAIEESTTITLVEG